MDADDKLNAVLEGQARLLDVLRGSIHPGTAHCLHETEIEEVRTQKKRRWMVVLLLVGSLLTIGAAVVDMSLATGRAGSELENTRVRVDENHITIEETRRELVKASQERAENIGEIRTAIGRLETKVEVLTEAVQRSGSGTGRGRR